MTSELEQLQKLIASNGTERQMLAISIAFHAALKLLQNDKELFAKQFGTLGAEIINDFMA